MISLNGVFEKSEVEKLRCCIGRHKMVGKNHPLFNIDGKVLCYDHAIEIVTYFEGYKNHPAISHNMIVRAHHERDEIQRKDNRIRTMRLVGERAPGFVYYIRIDQHIKIGYALDVAKRMRAYPPSAVLLAAHPGTKATEKQMHLEYRRYLDRGREWFTQGPKLMAHIDDVVQKFGDPKILAYEYTRAKRAG
jgi:hypothetical protein